MAPHGPDAPFLSSDWSPPLLECFSVSGRGIHGLDSRINGLKANLGVLGQMGNKLLEIWPVHEFRIQGIDRCRSRRRVKGPNSVEAVFDGRYFAAVGPISFEFFEPTRFIAGVLDVVSV